MGGMIINPFMEFPVASGPKTVALLHMQGLNGGVLFPDDIVANTWTPSNAVTSTGIVNFGTSSGDFNSDPTATLTSGGAISLGSGDFTIECFIYPSGGSFDIITCAVGSNRMGWAFNGTYFRVGNITSWSINLTNSTGLINAAWNHVAIVKTGTQTFKSFINGTLKDTTTAPGAFIDPNNIFIIGKGNLYATTSNNFDEFRISNIARYSGNFTPPAAPFVLD